MKMLYILNVANRVNNFCMSSLIAAKKMNIEYHIAGNWGYANDSERIADEEKYGIRIHQIDFIRSPIDIRNLKAYKQLKAIVSQEKYDIIHCNTPIGGVLGRLAGKKYKVDRIIYQAHGFHFYKGSPKLNWMVYYPIEKWLAHYTDALITINKEDYELAKSKMNLRNNGQFYYVPGVGIDLTKFSNLTADRSEIRNELGIPQDAKILISVGELNNNKNHETVIKAIKEIDVYYIIAGTGNKKDYLQNLIDEQGMTDRIKLLGYRTNIKDLFVASDIFVFPSLREGLPVSLMEAMASGMPCVVSNIRGNSDLISDNQGGFLVSPTDINAFADKINTLINDEELCIKMGAINKESIVGFSSETVERLMKEIYLECL